MFGGGIPARVLARIWMASTDRMNHSKECVDMAVRKHPLVEWMRYTVWLLLAATTHNPVALLIFLVALWCIPSEKFWRALPMDVALVAVTVLVNMLASHQGETYLFYINENVVTGESIIYGAVLGLQIVLLIHISALMSRRMTADKMVIVTGYLSPSLAILLSMAIRNIERYYRKIQEIYRYQKCSCRSETAWEHFLISVRTVSVMVSWALENGLETADSMTARGYHSARRTSYSPVRFMGQDGVECVLLLFFLFLWEWRQPFTILSPYVEVGLRTGWIILTAGYMVYELVEERYEDRYREYHNIRKYDSARCTFEDW